MKKVILITGASSGIGKETAIKLIQEGHVVYGAARRVEQMQDFVELGGRALKLDVSDEQQIVNSVKQIVQEQGGIDVLINNAGYGLYGAVEDVSIKDAKRQFEVNLFGLARMTQEVLPFMREKRSGKIINIVSMGGKMYTPLGSWYHATKHALEGWSDCLRLELKSFNIDVVIIEPGIIATDFGNIVYKSLLEISGNGAYSALANAMAKSTMDSYTKKNAASPPSIVANVILKAILSNKPATRYRLGKFAKLLVWMRIYMGDRIFDKIIMRLIK